MEVKYAHILEQIQHKNRTILCQIRVQPRKIQYFYGHPTIETSRWLQVDHWAGIDAGLAKILDKCNEFKDTGEERFQLNSSIEVRVRKSNISIRKLCQSICDVELKEKDVDLALECSIIWLDDKLKNVRAAEHLELFMAEEDHEYRPEFNASSYETYTASPVKDTSGTGTPVPGLSTTNIEEEYSPQPVHDDANESTPAPAYSAARIKTRRMKATEQGTSKSHSAEQASERVQMQAETVREKAHKRDRKQEKEKRDKVEKTKDKKPIPETQSHDEPLSSLEPSIKLEIGGSEETEMPKLPHDVDTAASDRKSPLKSDYSEVFSSGSINQDSGPRRSTRSPVKPHRLIEEKVESIRPLKSSSSAKFPKSHKKRDDRDLFGSSDDEDLNAFVETTPKPSTSRRIDTPMVSVSKNKRKRAQTFGDVTALDMWLGKKKSAAGTLLQNSDESKKTKSSSSDKSNGKKKHTPSASAAYVPYPIAYPTIEEMEEQKKREKVQIEENLMIRKYMEKLIPPTPEKVETLSLNDMSSDEICNTFPQHQAVLDDIFRQKSKKSNVRSNNGVDHFLVMNILEHTKQLDMMNKLRDLYEKDDEGSSLYTHLFANAMMPEWILRIFMDRHNFTRNQGIERIVAQDKYRLYLKECEPDSSFLSP